MSQKGYFGSIILKNNLKKSNHIKTNEKDPPRAHRNQSFKLKLGPVSITKYGKHQKTQIQIKLIKKNTQKSFLNIVTKQTQRYY